MPTSSSKDVPLPAGLTRDEARSRLEKSGPNAMPDTALHPFAERWLSFGLRFRG